MSEDRPQYQAERDTGPTHVELAERLRVLAQDMQAVGRTMAYYGGFDMIGFCGRCLVDMAQMPMDWAHEIEEAQG